MANNEEVKNQNEKKDAEVVANKENANKAQSKKANKKPVKQKKPNQLKKTFAELKNVTWPSFKSVAKQTAVVIVVSLVFLLVIFGIDKLCSWLIGLICS